MPEKTKRIIIRDLPGFADIEAKIRLYYNPNLPTPPYLDHVTDALSVATFGATSVQVWEEYERFEAIEAEDDLPEAVRNFEVAADFVDKSDEDAVSMLLQLGIDFRDERGWPLLSTRFYKWQALAAVAGMKGRLPDVEAAEVSRFATSLEDEAKRFIAGKRKA